MRTRRIFERCAGEPATKTCKLCGLEKPIAEFEVRADSQRRRYFCAECRRAYQRRRWAEAHPPRPYAKRLRSAASLECTRCHERKPGTEFPRKRAGGELVQSWCTECYSTYNAERYRALRDTEIVRLRRNRHGAITENRRRVSEFLISHPCGDCGEKDPSVLDFHHLRDKVAEVAMMAAAGMSWKRIEAEIEKCVVICANCHRRRHSRERNAKRLAKTG